MLYVSIYLTVKFSIKSFFIQDCGYKLTEKDEKFDDYRFLLILKKKPDEYETFQTFRITVMEHEDGEDENLEKRLKFFKKRIKIYFHKKDDKIYADRIEILDWLILK